MVRWRPNVSERNLSIYLLKMSFQYYILLNISGTAHYFQLVGGSEMFQFVPDALYILFFLNCILKDLDFLFYSSRQSHFLVLVLLFASTYETD